MLFGLVVGILWGIVAQPFPKALENRRNVVIYQPARCGWCKGKGKLTFLKFQCGVCKGRGSVLAAEKSAKCATCGGAGSKWKLLRCGVCHGTGWAHSALDDTF
jgi:DnaJ-class molecular chaperone